ncbi:hypothetical protein [Micromonospora sp. KC213]|uniref:hypothetical protein n=1 Tax=Micromonospora sp. KC213 TaxID=2530378 RepID=UPI001FB773C9|nr:hypothetical protein [Micromonospora sp. KC213]
MARPDPARPPGAGETGTEARPAPAAPGWRGGTGADARPAGVPPPEPTEARPEEAAPELPFEPGTWARARGELGSPYEFIPHTLPVAVGRGGATTGLP